MKKLALSIALVAPLSFSALAAPPERPEAAPLPASLAGSDVDGALRVDATGRFTPDADARRLFDYFLAATGEEPSARIQARIVATIEARLPRSARPEARVFLARYLRYRETAQTLPPVGNLEAGFARLQELRRDVFGADVARRVFGAEEDFDTATLHFLSQRTKGDEPRALAQRLEAQGTSVKASYDEALAPLQTARDEAALVARGGSKAELQALRESTVGPDAAARLATLDRENEAFQARLTAYRAARKALDAREDLGPSDLETAREALVNSRFSEAEAIRVKALDRIDGIDAR